MFIVLDRCYRFKSTDHSKSRSQIPRPDMSGKRSESTMRSKSTTVLDNKPVPPIVAAPYSQLTTTTVHPESTISGSNVATSLVTVDHQTELPVLIPLPMPQLVMPTPPQLFSLDNYPPYNPAKNEFNESFNLDTEKAHSESDSLKKEFRSEFKTLKSEQQKSENSGRSFTEEAGTVSKSDLLSNLNESGKYKYLTNRHINFIFIKRYFKVKCKVYNFKLV